MVTTYFLPTNETDLLERSDLLKHHDLGEDISWIHLNGQSKASTQHHTPAFPMPGRNKHQSTDSRQRYESVFIMNMGLSSLRNVTASAYGVRPTRRRGKQKD